MKRLRRWLFNFAAGVSLLLCLATATLWIISSRTGCQIVWAGDWSFTVFSEKGIVGLLLYEDNLPSSQRWRVMTYPVPTYTHSPGWWSEIGVIDGRGFPKVGIAYRQDRTPTTPLAPGLDFKYGNRPIHNLYLPHWLIVLLTLAFPIAWLTYFRRRRHRNRQGFCSACGYDLRATPDRCPECGMVSAEKKSSALSGQKSVQTP